MVVETEVVVKEIEKRRQQIESLAKLDSDSRIAALQSNPLALRVFEPHLSLPEEEFGRWHRFSHNDYMRALKEDK